LMNMVIWLKYSRYRQGSRTARGHGMCVCAKYSIVQVIVRNPNGSLLALRVLCVCVRDLCMDR